MFLEFYLKAEMSGKPVPTHKVLLLQSILIAYVPTMFLLSCLETDSFFDLFSIHFLFL
jgi:hypothetical protein